MDERTAIIAEVLRGWYSLPAVVREHEIADMRGRTARPCTDQELVAIIVFDQVEALCAESDSRRGLSIDQLVNAYAMARSERH